MKLTRQWLFDLQQAVSKHRGVFTASDLRNLLGSCPASFHQQLRPLLTAKILTRFCRGFYVAQNFDMEWLSQKINPRSAISLTTVLAKELIVGSIPQKTVYAVKMGFTRIYKSPLGEVVHLGFANLKSKDMWFGYDVYKNGIRYADKEKAFLDVLYFYQSGHKFSFNVYSDVSIDRLDRKKLGHYLSWYKNPKFVKFAKGVLDGQH